MYPYPRKTASETPVNSGLEACCWSEKGYRGLGASKPDVGRAKTGPSPLFVTACVDSAVLNAKRLRTPLRASDGNAKDEEQKWTLSC